MKYIYIIFGFTAILFSGCNNFSTDNNENSIANFKDKVLTIGDLNKVIPKNLSRKDSLNFTQDFINSWLKNQIIIEKAEKELPIKEKNIELELLQYKADLLKYKYEKFYIKNKINTQVPTIEIETYYDKNKNALLSTNTLVKAIYIELPIDIKDKDKNSIKKWIVSDQEKDQDKLKVLCFQKAKVFDDFGGEWIDLNSINLLVHSGNLSENNISENKLIELKNDRLVYFILVNQMIKKGQIMPLEYAKNEIAKIILAKRKKQLLEELNQKLKNQFEKLKSQ